MQPAVEQGVKGPESAQSQVGWDLDQPWATQRCPCQGQGIWNYMIFRDPFQPKTFYDSMSWPNTVPLTQHEILLNDGLRRFVQWEHWTVGKNI